MRRRHPSGTPLEAPAELRAFDPERWVEAGDWDPLGDHYTARHRWMSARMQWAERNGVDMVEWLQEEHRARRAQSAADWAARQDDGRGDD